MEGRGTNPPRQQVFRMKLGLKKGEIYMYRKIFTHITSPQRNARTVELGPLRSTAIAASVGHTLESVQLHGFGAAPLPYLAHAAAYSLRSPLTDRGAGNLGASDVVLWTLMLYMRPDQIPAALHQRSACSSVPKIK